MTKTVANKEKPQVFGDQPIHKGGIINPKFWHGMLPVDLFKLAWRNKFRVSPRGVISLTTAFASSISHQIGSIIQQTLHGKRIDKARPESPPLFVLGHWRSGTTFLHELLIRDPKNTYPTTYECFCPHHFLVTEKWVTPLTPWLLPKKRPMDNVATGWERPQEDEFALCSLGLPTPYRSWAFPKHGPVEEEWLTLEKISSADRNRWKQALRRFVSAISLFRQGRVVLKSPPHTARIKTILEIFPDAKFVHISRDPMILFPSTVRLWKSLSDVQGMQGAVPRHDWIEETVLNNLTEMYEAFERDLPLIPEGNYTELRYEDLVADTKGELRGIYDRLGLEGFENAEPKIDAFLAEQSDYKTNRYELPDDLKTAVRQNWRAYGMRFGYEM